MTKYVRIAIENGQYVIKDEAKKVYTLDEIAAIRREKARKRELEREQQVCQN